MTATRIGYARCSTDKQDLAAQRAALEQLGVAPERIYTDHGLTGTSRARPGLDQALAAVRDGDTLVVPKLDRLARSVPDARAIADALVARGVKLALGASVYDPADPMGKMFFNILATFAEFEADLIRLRTREGMAIARARGSCAARNKLSDRQQKEVRRIRHRRVRDQRSGRIVLGVPPDRLSHARKAILKTDPRPLPQVPCRPAHVLDPVPHGLRHCRAQLLDPLNDLTLTRHGALERRDHGR